MPELHSCPHGHEWQAGLSASATGVLPSVACPVCGAAAVTLSVALGPERTDVNEDASSDAAREAAILPDPNALAPGGSPRRYETLRLHAKGGLGEVFVARDGELNREVALKRIQADHAARPDSLRRFLVEAEVTGRLEHPGIVPVYGLGRDADGRPCYAMRLIQGETLQDAIRRFHGLQKDEGGRMKDESQANEAGSSFRLHPSSFGERRLAFRQLLTRFVSVCYTMAYAHSRGILHRDLKPANIMLGKFGETLIVDWGLAKPFERTEPKPDASEATLLPTAYPDQAATLTGAAIGTPAYMSPEQAEGEGALQTSDIYGLGATLYTLLTGEPPFHSRQVAEVLQQVRRSEFTRPRQLKPDTPKPLEAICLKAMALRPADRYATALDLAADLEHWLADEPVRAWREPWTAKARRWVGRHRTLVAGLGAAAVAAVLILSAVTAFLTAAWDSERLAKELAQRQEREAERQRDEAALQRDRAAKNAQRARDAVDSMLTAVADEQLRHVRGMEPVRRALLEKALVFYQGFLKEQSEDPATRLETARAHRRVGDINKLMGKHEEAQKAYREGLEVLAKLVADFPKEAAYRSEQAKTLNNLGNSFRITRNQKEAVKAFQQAIETSQQLVKDFPKELEYLVDLAFHHGSLGLLYQDFSFFADAEKHLRKELELHEEALRANPASDAEKHKVVRACINLARLGLAHLPMRESEQLQHKALALMEPLAARYPGHAPYQDDLATLYGGLGIVYRRTDRPADAEAAYQKALPIRERLAREHPQVPAYQESLAFVHGNLGRLYSNTNRLPQAETSFQQALGLRDRLMRDYPSEPNHQRYHAELLLLLGDIYTRTNRAKQAGSAFLRAAQSMEKLTDARPDVPDYQTLWADSLARLGGFYIGAQRDADGQAAIQKAFDLFQQVVKEHPKQPRYAIEMGGAYCNIGHAYRDARKPAEGLSYYVKAVQTLSGLLQAEEQDNLAKRYLRNSYHGQAEVLAALDRNVEALEAWNHAIAIQDGRSTAFYRVQHALTQVRLGRHAEAVRAADELAKKFTAGWVLFDGARIIGSAIPAARADGALDGPEREKHGEHYARRCLELLAQAQRAGFFKDEAGRSRLQTDLGLAEVRSRPDFKHFVAGVEEEQAAALGTANQPKQAEAAYRNALELREQLVRDQPKEPRYQSSLAATLHNLARFYEGARRFAEAEMAYQKALAIREQLVRDHQEVPAYRHGLGLCFNGLGIIYKETNRPREAEAAYRKAVEIGEALVRDHPQAAEYGVSLGGAYCNLGHLLRGGDQVQAAVESYGKAERILSALAAKDPQPALAKEYLVNTYRGRASAFTLLERHADALKDWDRAIELSDRDATFVQVQRARTRARVGDHGRAADDVKTLSEKFPQSTNGQLWYDLACVSALAASAAKKDADLSQNERDRLAEQHAARAVQLLGKARDAGHFKTPANQEALTKDKDLDCLRSRADFLKFTPNP